jgi:hypothetical protein
MCRNPDVQASIRDQFYLHKAVCTVGEVGRLCWQPITEAAVTAESEGDIVCRRLQIKENIRVLTDILQGNPEQYAGGHEPVPFHWLQCMV